MELKIGVRTHDVDKNTPEELFLKTKELGFKYIQLVFKKALLDSSYDSNYVERVKKALEANNIKVSMLGAYFNPVHSDKEVVKKGVEEFENNLKIADELDVDIVGSETGSYNDSPWTYVPKNHTEDGYQESLSVFKILRDYAYSCKKGIAVEGAWNHVIYDVKTMKRFIDELNIYGNVYATIDLFNLIYIGNYQNHREIFEEALSTFKERIKIIHLKDFIVEDGKIVQVAPGEGLFDYPFMLEKIQRYCPDATLIFEGVKEPNLSSSYDFLKKLETKY